MKRGLFFDFDSTLTTPIVVDRFRRHAVADRPEIFQAMTDEEIVANFGGRPRIQRLMELFQTLSEAGCELFIVSIGLRDPCILPHLRAVGLLKFFKEENVYGQDSPELQAVRFVKGRLIASLMAARGWALKDALFIDDSFQHIQAAARVCEVLHVAGQGLGDEELDRIGASAAGVAEAAVSFVSIGDWGGAGINGGGDYHKTNELAVAKQLGQTAAEVDAKFVINTGDNFYYCGTQNITDEQFKIDFEDVYTAKSLSVKWYGVLGNHDYAYDVKSQFDYKSPVNDRWQLPTFYYTKRLLLSGSQYVTFVFIDTSPCIASYRADDPSGWDPCSGKYGECQDAAGKCHFHEHILAQDCSAQLAWFKKTLAAISKDDWVMVVGHHEADYIDVEDFTAAMLSSDVRLYLNGHTHAMKHYQVDDRTDIDFVTTGAGCMVHTHDQDVCLSSSCRNDEEEKKHSARELFYQKTSAFSVHTFAEDFSSLKTDFVDSDGNVIHSFTTAKKGGSPSPSPPSPPPPSPHGDASCQKFGCGSFKKEHPCQCNPTCKFHGDCCDDFDELCGGPSPSPPSNGTSCEKYGCGRFSKRHKCQCNWSCKYHGDCCGDYDKVCGKSEPELVI